MPHLLLAVSAHGYGHLAQSAPVIRAIARRLPGLRITLQSNIDPWFARSRLPPGCTQVPWAADPGFLMESPLATRWTESLAAYVRFAADYDRHLEHQSAILRDLAPDLVLCDIPWLPLDAAHRLGISAVGLCSFTWVDILEHCHLRDQVPRTLLGRMQEVYGQADLFIRPVPAMPMDWLPQARTVGPIATRRRDQGTALRARLGIPSDRPLALMQFGGIAGLDPLGDWPEQDQVHWLVMNLERPRRDATALADHGIDLQEVLGSVDLILTKPGYGSYAEAACNGVPVLRLPRTDWPETPALDTWLAARVPTRELRLDDLLAGRVAGPIADLLAAGRVTPVEPTGIEESADLLEDLLR